MDVDAPPRFGAPRDPLGSTNPPEFASTIGLDASLPPLPLKQDGKALSIVWNYFIKLANGDP